MNEDEYIKQLIDAGATDEEIAELLPAFRAHQAQPTQVAGTVASQEEQTAQGSPVMDSLNTVGAYTGIPIRRGLETLVSLPLKLIGAGADELGRLGERIGLPKAADESLFTQAGQAAQEGVEFLTPTTKEAEESYLGQALGGIGQGVAMIASGGLGGAARAGTLATQAPSVARTLGQSFASRQAFLGGAMTAIPEYEAAKKAGASEDEAFDVLWKNYLVGQTEALPLHTFLRAINSKTGGLLIRTLKGMTEGGITEAAQETLQTYLSNKIAQGSYDPDRDPIVGLAEAAGLGAVVGAIIPGAGIIGKRFLIDQEVEKAIKETSPNLDPTVAASIDKVANEVTQTTLQNNAQIKEEVQTGTEGTGVRPASGTTSEGLSETAQDTRLPDNKWRIESIIEKVNNGEAISQEEADLLTQREQSEVSEPIQGLTVTATTVPDLSSGDENKTKKVQAFEFNDPAGEARGYIDEKSASASIIEIFAAKDKEGNVKKGGGLYKKLIDKLRNGGIHYLSIGMQSPASTKVLEKLTNEGVLRPVDAEKRRFEIVDKRFTKKQISNLVTKFNKRGMTLGATEESKSATKDAAVEQLRDFFTEHGITSREDMDEFADRWNTRRPERAIKPSEVSAAYKLVVSPKEQGPTITIPVNTQVRNLIKTFTEGIEKGVRRGQKMVNENLIPKVQKALKEARLSRRQTSAILTKLKTTNLFTPSSYNKLQTFIDKVVADSEHADKLGLAGVQRRKLRRLGRRKADKEPHIYKPLAELFGQIDPSRLNNVDEFIKNADEVLGGFRSTKDPAYAAPDVDKLQKYGNEMLERQEQEQQQELEDRLRQAEANAAMGLGVDGEDYEAGEVPLLVIADNTKKDLEDKDISNFNERDKKTVEQVKKIDLTKLDEDQLVRFIKIVDNIVKNDDMSGSETIQIWSEVQEELTKLNADKPTTKETVGIWGKGMNNWAATIKQIWQDSGFEARFREFATLDLGKFGSQARKMDTENRKKLDELARMVNKKYGVEVRELDKKAELSVFALLYQGTTEKKMNRIHGLIKQSISRHEDAANEEEHKALRDAYKPFENVTTPEETLEVVKKVSPYSYEMWQFFGNDKTSQKGLFNKELAAEQRDVSSRLFNRGYIDEENYTPLVQHDVNALYKTASDIVDQTKGEGPLKYAARSIKARQARTAQTRTLTLGENKVISLDPYADWLGRHNETWYTNKASYYESRVAEMIRNKMFTELMGNKENAAVEANNLLRITQIQRGTHRIGTDSEIENGVNNLLGWLRTLGTVKALARFSQFFSQSTVAVKTYFNLISEGGAHLMPGAYHAAAQSMMKGENHPVSKFFAQTTLVDRTARAGGTDQGTSVAYKLQRGARKEFLKTIERYRIWMDRKTRSALQTITTPDVLNARASFLAYYEHYLEKRGMKDIDLNTEWKRTEEKERRLAIAYAENMIEQTQTASNPAFMSPFQAQDASAGWQILKTAFLPFSTFDADFKARFVNELSAVKNTKGKEQGRNIVKLGGTFAEAAAFSMLSAFWLYWYREWIKDAIRYFSDVEKKELTPEEHSKKQWQQFRSSFFAGINPIAIGTVGQELQNWTINTTGHWLANPDNLSKKDWLKERGWVYEPREGNTLENLGAYSSGLYPITEMGFLIPDIVNSIGGEPVKTIDGFGNERYVTLSPEQQNILMLKLFVEASTLSGLTEADIANGVRDVWREQLKLAPTADTTPKRKSNEPYRERKFSLPKE